MTAPDEGETQETASHPAAPQPESQPESPSESPSETQSGTQGQPRHAPGRHARRPGGDPEDHTPAHGFGDEVAGETEVEAAGDELAAAQKALAERTLDLQRLQAEYLNYKRRVDRDRDLVKQNAVFAVLTNLLPVLDDIDRAREHGELEGGFKAVADALERVVSGLGLTKFGTPGDEFDPNLHEALMHGHSADVTTTTVDVVAHAGYRIGDRVVRAAKVTVLDPEG